ncbi:hypothetical protein MNV49_006320 [Pseudohyphozyma bogoriensis]|nr:hypothetical protein MNV49_006320 [Pseudohyphozyma bogoriensis]
MSSHPSDASDPSNSPPSSSASDVHDSPPRTANEFLLITAMTEFCKQPPSGPLQQLATDTFVASTRKDASQLRNYWFRYYDTNVRGNQTAIDNLYMQSLTPQGCAEIVDLVIAFTGPPSRSRPRSKRKEGELRKRLLRQTVL